MAFDNEDWTRRLRLAKSTDEITAMIMELPDGPRPEQQKETEEDGRELYLLEGRTPVRCYDERDVYFYAPIYGKIAKDCIRGLDITTMFLFMDERYNGRTHWLGGDGPLLFATSIRASDLSRETKLVEMLCGTYEEAEQMHQVAIERVCTTPFAKLASVYPNMHERTIFIG
ncbi:hypothetical protein SAMN05216299_12714 [Nitrosospira sp. Nsp14]|uniref:hypothetical protein n=1 Tax=Nitrosospira sp. Nsp14 TaxID=1855333 RepID=UPI0008EBBFB5|nr:hypothetical protein [Nitrosospira sp. Nsp14]SFH58706.1 hypothetical protein SAMN05216299_12714 [Nitrosospira sp. Nsp14]